MNGPSFTSFGSLGSDRVRDGFQRIVHFHNGLHIGKLENLWYASVVSCSKNARKKTTNRKVVVRVHANYSGALALCEL